MRAKNRNQSAPSDAPSGMAATERGPGGELSSPNVIQSFLDFYWIKHPISNDTLTSYRGDLLGLGVWLEEARNKTLVTATAQDLRDFLEVQYSSANRLLDDMPSLSCIKRFYFYLMTSKLRDDDPTEQLYVRPPRPIKSEAAAEGKQN